MTKTLTLDEMLDCFRLLDEPEAVAIFARQLEAIGDHMASALGKRLAVDWGATHSEESAFAGTCATFTPAAPGDACPFPLDQFDVCEWEEEEQDAPPHCTIEPHGDGWRYRFEGDDDPAPLTYPTRADAIAAAHRVG